MFGEHIQSTLLSLVAYLAEAEYASLDKQGRKCLVLPHREELPVLLKLAQGNKR